MKKPIHTNPKLFLVAVLILFLFGCSKNNEESFDWVNNGVKMESGKVIAYFPKDSIDESKMIEIVDSLNIGIESAIRYIGGPYEWQEFKDKPITYYFEPGQFVSVTDIKGDIYIPLFRIKSYTAPWLHETMHALLRNSKGNWNEFSKVKKYFSMPIWFTEGMAEYLAIKIEAVDSIKRFDLMKFGGYKNVDSSCYKALTANPKLISDIGVSGVPTKLVTSRKDFAPPFYSCSCSFTKYLTESYGLDKMLKANSEFTKEEETIELLTGKKMEIIKEDWIVYLKSNQATKQ